MWRAGIEPARRSPGLRMTSWLPSQVRLLTLPRQVSRQVGVAAEGNAVDDRALHRCCHRRTRRQADALQFDRRVHDRGFRSRRRVRCSAGCQIDGAGVDHHQGILVRTLGRCGIDRALDGGYKDVPGPTSNREGM